MKSCIPTRFLSTLLLVAGLSTGPTNAQDAGTYGGGFLDDSDPDLVFSFGLGAQSKSAYFGSDELEFGSSGTFRFDFLRLPNGFTLGTNRSVGYKSGFGLQGAARFIGKRDVSDHSELRGLDDVDTTLELGMGVGYEQEFYRVYGNVRYGFFGHEAFVGEIGADAIVRPADGWTLRAGPRLDFGDDDFADTYFGVSPANAAASRFGAYDPDGGLISAGLEFNALYQFNPRWAVQGTVSWDRLLNDAADSPITQAGDDDQFKVKVVLIRRVAIDF